MSQNESLDILFCISDHGPISAEEIAQKTGYHRHLVDVTIPLLIEYGYIYQSGMTPDRPQEWQDPVYKLFDGSRKSYHEST